MPVVERLMKPGSWDLQLVPETPKAIRDVLQPFGHIVIYEARVDPRVMADADMLTGALYAGPMRHKPNPYSLQGAGMLVWLGDEEGKGFFYNPALTANTFTFAMTQALGGAVTAGTIQAMGGSITWSATRVNQRTAIDYITAQFGGEYRVNNNGTLDAGDPTVLFKLTPTVIAMPREGGRDGGLSGIDPTVFSPEIDADSYTTKVILVGAGGNGSANISPATTYKDIHGNLVDLERVVTNSLVPAGQEAANASLELAKYPLRQVVTLSTDRYDIPHDVRAGDWLYVYDPEHDLVDTNNAQNYRGQITYPMKLRVYAITWPVETGMSVFYRDSSAVYTDITNWVVFDQPGTSFELGFPLRGLTVP